MLFAVCGGVAWCTVYGAIGTCTTPVVGIVRLCVGTHLYYFPLHYTLKHRHRRHRRRHRRRRRLAHCDLCYFILSHFQWNFVCWFGRSHAHLLTSACILTQPNIM